MGIHGKVKDLPSLGGVLRFFIFYFFILAPKISKIPLCDV